MRMKLMPASKMRVHHQRFHGMYGSRGRSELMPKPSWIWLDLRGTKWFGNFLPRASLRPYRVTIMANANRHKPQFRKTSRPEFRDLAISLSLAVSANDLSD